MSDCSDEYLESPKAKKVRVSTGKKPAPVETPKFAAKYTNYGLESESENDEDTKEEVVPVKESKNKCKHLDTIEDDGYIVCRSCGVEREQLSYEPEWRFYGESDNKSSRDPSRCHITKIATKGIGDVISKYTLNVSDSIRMIAESKYLKIIGTNTVRGRDRRAIVAACLLFAYRESGDFRSSKDVGGTLGLTTRQMSAGLNQYFEVFPQDRQQVISATDLIRRTLRLVGIPTDPHFEKIKELAQKISSKQTKTLKRSNPNSVASAIVYLYLCMNTDYRDEIGITKKKFAAKVDLSDNTIGKLAKKCAELLNINVKI